MNSTLSSEIVNNKSTTLEKMAQENKVGKLKSSKDLNSFVCFPMALQPYKITQQQYEKMIAVSKLWQKITHLASKDKNLIIETFNCITKDPIITPLLKLYTQIEQSESNQKKIGKVKFQLFRTDYFVTNEKIDNIKMIEYNCVSVSMAGISQQFIGCQLNLWGKEKNLICNESTNFYAKQIAEVYLQNGLDGIIIVVVQEHEVNILDQNLLLQNIFKLGKVQFRRVLLQNLDSQTYLDQNNNLFHQNGQKISLVYYRSGYSSKQPISWKGFYKCNRSLAINIPSVSSFLVNTKKMQFELSKRQVMVRYLTQQESDLLQSSVIEGWQMKNDSDRLKLLEMIKKEGSSEFVLKPNEEGGKNNIFGEEVFEKLKQFQEADLPNYILIRRVTPRAQQNYIVPNQNSGSVLLESQVSIYGIVTSKDGESQQSFRNVCDGYLVRSKVKGNYEAGLMSGGVLGSLEICDENKGRQNEERF